jgi:tetratricopeptide (TPR) repeat protein
MKFDPILTNAIRLLKKGNYGRAIQFLESEALRYRDSFYYYYILASACLRTGDYGGAATYFKRARDIRIRDPLAMAGLAVLSLRRGEVDKAVDFYLEIQERDPNNRIVKKALRAIRKNAGSGKIAVWIDSGKLSRFYPPVPKLSLASNRLFLPLCVLVCAAGILAALLRFNVIRPFPPKAEREGFAGTALEREEREEPFQIDGSYRYVLTRDQVLDAYAEARKLFADYRDENAKTVLNRILESNAPDGIKNKARLLFSYTTPPGFDTFSERDSFKYAEVLKDPPLYRDCYVIWQGMAANLEIRQNTTVFTFLVGYDTRTTLEGQVPVTFNAAIPVNPELPLKVLARVIPAAIPGGMDIHLEGVAVQQAGLLQPPAAGEGGR